MGLRSKLPPLGIAALFILAVLIAGGVPSETHTTYINGSRVQSPELIGVGNLTAGNVTNNTNNSVVRIYPNGTIQRTNTSTGAVLPLKLGGILNASGFAIPNAVLDNATIAFGSSLQTNKMTSIHLIPLNATGWDWKPGTTLAEVYPTYRTYVDFANVNYSFARFVANVQGSNNTAGAGKCLAITRQGGGGGNLVIQCWSGNAQVNMLVSNWTAISYSADTTLGVNLNASSATETITLRGVEVQLR